MSTIEVDFDDLTRAMPGQSLSKQLESRSCTTAYMHDSNLYPMVGVCFVIEIKQNPDSSISQAMLEQSFRSGWENAERILRSTGNPIQLTQRLLIKTSTNSTGAVPLSIEALKWLSEMGYFLVGTDCPRMAEDDETAIIEFLTQSKMTYILNLELRGITCGALHHMVGTAPALPSAGLVPARVLLMF